MRTYVDRAELSYWDNTKICAIEKQFQLTKMSAQYERSRRHNRSTPFENGRFHRLHSFPLITVSQRGRERERAKRKV